MRLVSAGSQHTHTLPTLLVYDFVLDNVVVCVAVVAQCKPGWRRLCRHSRQHRYQLGGTSASEGFIVMFLLIDRVAYVATTRISEWLCE